MRKTDNYIFGHASESTEHQGRYISARIEAEGVDSREKNIIDGVCDRFFRELDEIIDDEEKEYGKEVRVSKNKDESTVMDIPEMIVMLETILKDTRRRSDAKMAPLKEMEDYALLKTIELLLPFAETMEEGIKARIFKGEADFLRLHPSSQLLHKVSD